MSKDGRVELVRENSSDALGLGSTTGMAVVREGTPDPDGDRPSSDHGCRCRSCDAGNLYNGRLEGGRSELGGDDFSVIVPVDTICGREAVVCDGWARSGAPF